MTVIAIANQKGGVGKTTTTHSLGDALAADGARVLLVDLDPQACLTYAAGLDPESIQPSLHDVLLGRADAAAVVTAAGRCSLLPASIDLAGSEVVLATKVGREHALARALAPIKADYDLVLVDCPPSLGILTINGLTAADEVLIPLQAEALGQRGVAQLMDTIDDVRSYTNKDLQVRGVIATMFDGRTKLARQVVEQVQAEHGVEVFDPPVPKSVKVAEAPGRGRSVLEHAPGSKGAVAYRELAERIFAKPKGAKRAKT